MSYSDLYPSPDSPYSMISPSYLMDLAGKVEKQIDVRYKFADNIRRYFQRWHVNGDSWNNENFQLITDYDGVVDVAETLGKMHPELLVRMAIDLGVDTPGMLPSIPTFRNTLKEQNPYALTSFDKAVRNVIDQPEEAVSAASSALEGLLKTIAGDESLGIADNAKGQVGERLLNEVLRALELKTNLEVPKEIRTISKRLQAIGDEVFNLRSRKTLAHGTDGEAYIVDDPLWSALVVNATATLGMFLWEFYAKTKRAAEESEAETAFDDEIPF